MASAHGRDGLRGVVLVYVAAIAAVTWLWFRVHWAMGGNFLLACAMAAPMLSTANMHWLARPHVFSWLCLLALVWYAERDPDPLRPRHAVAVFLGSALWANLHASFFLAPLILTIYALAGIAGPWIWSLDAARERGRARRLLAAALCAAAGSLVNPYGWNLHLHVARYLADDELLARVGEFQSFNFHAEGAGQILLAVGLVGLGAVSSLGRRNLARFLIAAGLLAMALRSARALPLMALVGLPVANAAITAACRQARNLHPTLTRWLTAVLDYSANLRAHDSRFHGLAWVPVLVLATLLALRTPALSSRAGFPPDQFPVAAAQALDRLPADIRLLAPDKFGGYLIYRFGGRRKVFFDGRSDFYGSAFMKDYIRLVQVRPGWQKVLASFGFTHALLPNDYSLVAALEAAGWRRLYRDDVATLLNAPSGPRVIQ